MRPQRKPRVGKGFEQLEDRRMNAVTVGLVDNALVINGDDLANSVTIERHEYTRTIRGTFGIVVGYEQVDDLRVRANGTYRRFAAADVERIQVDLKGGDDLLTFTGNPAFAERPASLDKPATLSLGAGHDYLRISFDFVENSARDLEVNAGDGNDVLEARLGNIAWSDFSATAAMGNGADTAEIEVVGDLEGSAVFQLWGEAGNDDLMFLAEESYYYTHEQLAGVGIDSFSKLSVQLSGGDGDDTLGFGYRGILEGSIDLGLSGGAGRDTAWIDLDLQPRSDGSLHAKIWNVDDDDWLVRVYGMSDDATVFIEEQTPFATMPSYPAPQLAPLVSPPSLLSGGWLAPSGSTLSTSGMTAAKPTSSGGLWGGLLVNLW